MCFGPGSGILPAFSLSRVLTDAQEALLGCGRLYGTNCDVQGVDLFNVEISDQGGGRLFAGTRSSRDADAFDGRNGGQ